MKPRLGISACLFLFLSSFQLTYGKQNCSEDAFDACLMMLEKVNESAEMAFATTMAELNVACRPLRQSITCVDNFMNHCINVVQRNLFNSVVAGSRQTMNDLCIHGKMQTEYLRHASCIKNVSTDPNRCAPYYQKVVQYSHSLNQNNMKNMDVALRGYCCAMTEFIQCQNVFTTKDCGADASHFLQKHTEKMSGSLIHQHCIVYTFGSNACMEETTSIATKRIPDSSLVHIAAIISIILMILSP